MAGRLCIECKHRVSWEEAPPFAEDVCSHPSIGLDMVSGKHYRTTCFRQRHIQPSDAIVWSVVPALFCGPEGRYFEFKDE